MKRKLINNLECYRWMTRKKKYFEFLKKKINFEEGEKLIRNLLLRSLRSNYPSRKTLCYEFQAVLSFLL
jgi:hypothetical protein